ncbi:MAG TPA: DUF1080 domain-containing protein [Longimicrobiales bacterium]
MNRPTTPGTTRPAARAAARHATRLAARPGRRAARPAPIAAATAATAALLVAALAALATPAHARQAAKSAGEPAPNTLTAEERAAGWRLLFDGRTTAGWRGFKKESAPAGWAVEDGTLTRVAPAGDLITVETFADFELTLEWKVEPGGNSGIFFRVVEADDVAQTYESGPEMQVLDNARHPDGKSPLTSAGANYALHAPIRDVSRPAGEWNQVRLVVDGAHVEHWLNGTKIVEYELWTEDWERRVRESKFAQWPRYGRAREGHIAIQDHGDRVWFRNIKVRRLPPTP